jgi:protein-L-isoaspartate(D-aspartate) O-methyltransferase
MRQFVEQIAKKQRLSPSIQAAFLAVPRLHFVKAYYVQQGQSLRWTQIEADARMVYQDQALVTQLDARGMPSSSSSQPSIMAAMLEALDIQEGQRILEIGAGTGYNAALLSQLVGAAGQVVTIDISERLVEQARLRLQAAGYTTVQVACANGLHGYAQAGPYDRIIVTGGFPCLSSAWLDQLVAGGKLVGNLLCSLSHSIVVVTKQGDGTASGRFLPYIDAAFMQLREAQEHLQPVSPINLTAYAQQPLIGQAIGVSPETSDVLMALADPTFLFYLQWHAPSLVIRPKWGSPQSASPTMNYLLDRDSLTSVEYPIAPDSIPYHVHVRGQYNLWEQVQEVYQQWNSLQRPGLDAYQLEIQSGGQHTIMLGPARLSNM